MRPRHVPLHDAGLVWGATTTDLCRTFRHRLFRWDDHLHRFQESCRLARIPLARDANELTKEAHELVAKDAAFLAPEEDLALVLIATPGPIGFYVGESGGAGDAAPTLEMHTFPLPWVRYRRLVTEGARLVTPSIPHLPATHVPRQAKHRSRLFWWLAEKEAHDVDPLASALLLDHDGCVTETASANFLLVKEGVVVSAPRSRILNGVSLKVAEEICHGLGIPFLEREITLEDCLGANEALLTCTTFCLAPVAMINGQSLGADRTIYTRMAQAWNDVVGLDFRQQILRAGGRDS